NRRASSSSARRRSTEASCEPSSAAISGSSAAISTRSSRSAASASSDRSVSRRRCADACAPDVFAAASWSSPKPGCCISSSRLATRAASRSAAKVVREQPQALAYLLDALGNGALCSGLGHGARLESRQRLRAVLERPPAPDPTVTKLERPRHLVLARELVGL